MIKNKNMIRENSANLHIRKLFPQIFFRILNSYDLGISF